MLTHIWQEASKGTLEALSHVTKQHYIMPFQKGNQLAKKSTESRLIKKKRWHYLEGKLVDDWSLNVTKHMTELWKSGEKQQFMDNYLSLLNYFKPKLGSQTIQSQGNRFQWLILKPSAKLL